MSYYNSIQDGACCPDCFREEVEKAQESGNLIALSEQYRTNAGMINQIVTDHLEGLPKDPFIEEGYVDRVIIQVTDGTDPAYPSIRELIIISASLAKDECYCTK
jgi:hypothetical protein